jgi:hypothetical protein
MLVWIRRAPSPTLGLATTPVPISSGFSRLRITLAQPGPPSATIAPWLPFGWSVIRISHDLPGSSFEWCQTRRSKYNLVP